MDALTADAPLARATDIRARGGTWASAAKAADLPVDQIQAVVR